MRYLFGGDHIYFTCLPQFNVTLSIALMRITCKTPADRHFHKNFRGKKNQIHTNIIMNLYTRRESVKASVIKEDEAGVIRNWMCLGGDKTDPIPIFSLCLENLFQQFIGAMEEVQFLQIS